MDRKMADLKERILDICFKHKLSHMGSYFSSVGIIDDIYSKMTDDDIFILSPGHCAVALYAVLEKYKGVDADKLFEKHGGHPHRDEQNHIFCSTGSLGMGLLVAIGRAMANPKRKVYCLISDGECAEGSIWEGLKFIYENNIQNIEVYANINGYAAYDSVDVDYLCRRLKTFLPKINLVFTKVNHFDFLNGLNAHYHIMSKEDYDLAKKELRLEKRV
jgi:transketolase